MSKSPGIESRGRSRSNSVARKKSAARAASDDNNNNSTEVAPRRSASRKSKSKATATTAAAAAVVTPATSVEVTETAFVSAKQHSDDDTDVLLRSTIQALGTPAIRTVATDAAGADKLMAVTTTTTTTTTTKTASPAVRKSPRGAKASPASAVKTESKTIALAYEDSDSRVVAQTTETIETVETTTTSSHQHHQHQHNHVSETSSMVTETVVASTTKTLDDDDGSSLLLASHAHRHHASSARHKDGGVRDMLRKMTERGWLVSFLSVAVVVGSLLASQLVPRSASAADTSDDLWRAWLPFLTPIVALLLFFHQRDDRASAKWIAIALSWRCAGELLVLVEATPREFATVAASCAAIAHLALVLALGAIVRNREHESSKATLVALTLSVLALVLSDRCVLLLVGVVAPGLMTDVRTGLSLSL